MTVHFCDVSNWQQGMSLAGMPAVIAKATEGTTYTDPYYAGYLAQARVMGVPFAAYHWLHAADVPGQARHAYSVVGSGVPLMVDDEDTGDGLSIDRTLAFVGQYRALGGRVTLEYLPRWFWADHGSPDLRPLAAAGLALVASNYTTYSDTGPGWQPYGGVTPAIWQYTSSATINGRANVDMNAFRGTVEQLRALIGGGPTTVEEDMETFVKDGEGNWWFCAGDTRRKITQRQKDDIAYWHARAGRLVTTCMDDDGKNPKMFVGPDLDIWGVDIATLQGGGPGGPVDVKAIAKAVNDDAAARLAE